MKRAPDLASASGLDEVLAVARAAAHEAATLALGGFRRELVVEHKGEIDLVTDFDRRCETLLRERLAEALPFAIVGEEHGGSAHTGDGDVVFYVDPIDGTTNYVHGHPFWCVSIGLVSRGSPILGVVVAPALGTEWWGFTCAEARVAIRRTVSLGGLLLVPDVSAEETRPLRVSSTPDLANACLATGFPYDRRTSPDNNFDEFVAIKRQCLAIRRCGSAAIDLCLVADGTYDGYWEKKLSPWDLAGGVAIVRGAGGRVSELDGGDFLLRWPDGWPDEEKRTASLLATNGPLHDSLGAAIARAEAERRQL